MLRVRVIPALLLRHGSLVKTRRFRGTDYIGDPCNTLRIFNELEVDELAVLDIEASRECRGPDFDLLADIASECFMPLSYGGGLTSFEQAARVFGIGFEKVIVNSAAYNRPELLTEIAETYGSQAVVASIDVGRTVWGREAIYSHGGRRRQSGDPVSWAREVERRGAGEILLTAIEREGTWDGFDVELVRRVSAAVSIPVIAQGGASTVDDLSSAVREGGASSVAVGAMVVYQKKGCGVLVNFPERGELEAALGTTFAGVGG
ncbi:AglZ/HisF2 family acetamidino modification protein [Tsuneonella sp. HG094]